MGVTCDMNNEFCLVYVIVRDKQEALDIASIAIKKKLAACGNILPEISSVYIWKDKLQSDNETLLILKSNAENYKSLEKLILEHHSYDNPCILKLPIRGGNINFLDWINKSLI